jgi:hypothetical protein
MVRYSTRLHDDRSGSRKKRTSIERRTHGIISKLYHGLYCIRAIKPSRWHRKQAPPRLVYVSGLSNRADNIISKLYRGLCTYQGYQTASVRYHKQAPS